MIVIIIIMIMIMSSSEKLTFVKSDLVIWFFVFIFFIFSKFLQPHRENSDYLPLNSFNTDEIDAHDKFSVMFEKSSSPWKCRMIQYRFDLMLIASTLLIPINAENGDNIYFCNNFYRFPLHIGPADTTKCVRTVSRYVPNRSWLAATDM